MEPGTTETCAVHNSRVSITDGDDDRFTQQRLTNLLEINAEIARERCIYRTDRERVEAGLMTNPIDSKKAFAYFGLLIGLMPPFALVFKIISSTVAVERMPVLFLVVLGIAGVTTGVVGYASGQFVPAAISGFGRFRLANQLALFSLVGFVWGAVSGAIGGLFIFIIGAFVAAIAGGIIGALALPVLVAFHTALRRGDLIEIKHFLPIAFGITLSLCAFILGL
jgi:hypothetical protein